MGEEVKPCSDIDVEVEDALTRALSGLRSGCMKVTVEVQALREENRLLKVQLDALRTPGQCAEQLDVRPPVNLPGSTEMEVEAADTRPNTPAERKVMSSRSGKKKTKSFGIPDSPTVSLSAARLGMVTQRNELMEELETADLRHMVSEFMPSISNIKGPTAKNWLQKLSRHLAFKIFVILVIVANAIYLGIDADLQVKNSYRHILKQDLVPQIPVLNLLFPVLFVVELVIRMVADGRNFFQDDERWWNIVDIALVLSSLVEILLPVTFTDLSVLRILRVFRMVRVIRVVKHVKWLKNLRTMVFALINSFVSLMWAFFMILLIIFVFSILFCHGVAAYNNVLDLDDQIKVGEAIETQGVFGSMYETAVSLFGAVSGGNDWMYYGEFLRKLKRSESDLTGEVYFNIFAFYVAFCTVGLLNVVTGIFVDSAVTTRTEDEVVDAFKDEMNNRQQEVRRIFTEAVGADDHEAVGGTTLTFEKLKEQLNNPWVKAYFSGLDIDPNEAAIIFTLMDTDHNGKVTIDEFIDGTMKLKGSAKSTDMLLLMFDHVRFISKFNTLCCYLEDEMRSIKSVIAPGMAPAKIFESEPTGAW